MLRGSFVTCRGVSYLQTTLRLLSTTSDPVSTISAPAELVPAVNDAVSAIVTKIPDHNWYNIVASYQDVLNSVQVTSDLPWWAVLFCAGMCMRSALLPISVKQQKNYLRDAPHTIHITKIRNELIEANKRQDHVMVLTKQAEMKFYKKKHDIWSPFWLMIPGSMMLTLNFWAITRLAKLPYQPLVETSLLHLPNLTLPDPYYILPAVNAVAIIYGLKKGIDSGGYNPLGAIFENKIVVGSLVTGLGVCQSFFPSGMLMFWIGSNAVGLLVVQPLLQKDSFRKTVGLLPKAEANEIMGQMATVETLKKQTVEAYESVREEGHKKDLEARKAKLAELTQAKVAELNDTQLSDLKQELATENQRLREQQEIVNARLREMEAELKQAKEGTTGHG